MNPGSEGDSSGTISGYGGIAPAFTQLWWLAPVVRCPVERLFSKFGLGHVTPASERAR